MRTVVPFRLLRSSMLALTTLSLAAGAHTAGGGSLPEPILLLALAAFTLMGSMLACRWKLTTPVILALLSGSQLALHLGFEFLSANPMSDAMQSTLQTATEHGHQHGTTMVHYFPQAMPAHNSDSPGMLIAHLVAIALTGLLLSRGEAALWALADWLRPLFQLTAPSALPTPFRLRWSDRPVERAVPQRYLNAQRWRGPPSSRISISL
ncbi:hypothetical protein FHU41_002080 [Psychromicrobium silvestre]|uniref:Uncharacterized protein n=1 Tax=Psychromicrobium silvestre TaxID=1645614 RepID=A0A7Y9LUG6_9MICC|nr:hypothetical protein [Psychromicrobium silvestre]NYE95830.1 hypothetical protein [Psychromicrobium silvestre]